MFTGQTGNYVTLSSASPERRRHPTQIDASGATFGGFQAGGQPVNATTLPSFYATEDKIADYLDDGTLGYVKLKTANEFVSHNSSVGPQGTCGGN